MRAIALVLCLFASSNAWALDAPPLQCSETHGFGLSFGDRASGRDISRALRAYPGYSGLFINDGDTAHPTYRTTAVARYDSPEQAQAMINLMIAEMLASERFEEQFGEGSIDDETLENGIIFYSGDFELNQGVAMRIEHEYTSVFVTCTELRLRAAAFTGSAR